MKKWHVDIGLNKEVYPDWSQIEVDVVAQWVIDQIPDDQWESTFRAISSAYEKISEYGNTQEEIFARISNDNIYAYIAIKEETYWVDEFGYDVSKTRTIIRGTIRDSSKNIVIEADRITLNRFPESIMQNLKKGQNVSRFIDIETHKNRIIKWAGEETNRDGLLENVIILEPEETGIFETLYGLIE